VASLILDFDTSVLHARDERDTAHLIYWLARREQIEAGKKVAIRARRKPKELRRLQEEIVAGLPGVSSVLAKRLLARFNTIQRVFVASEAQLKKVRGIGEKLAKRIRRVLTASYGT
jgi:Fanconi anemia group M protein